MSEAVAYSSSPLIDQIDPDRFLPTTLFSTGFRSPLVVASGTLVEHFEEIEPYIDAGAGAVIPRSTRLVMQRTVHPSPHLYMEGKGTNASMINGEWTGAAIDYWRPYLEETAADNKTIMSVSGRDIAGCVEVCKELDAYEFPLLEVNISCGVSNGVHGYITRNEEHISELVYAVKAAGVTTPIALKLGHSDGIVELSGVAKDAGADAITAINTYGPVFDFRIRADGKAERIVGAQGAKGGLSGSEIFHTALTDVAEITRQIDIPVLASGGVTSPERAVKMIMAGAYLVQLYSTLHEKGVNATAAMTRFTRDMITYMGQHQMQSVNEIRGSALDLMEKPTELDPKVPVIDLLGCIGCNACVRVCLPQAIDEVPAENKIGHAVSINQECVGCGICITQCPVPGVLTLPDAHANL